jgi:hypothetical protein
MATISITNMRPTGAPGVAAAPSPAGPFQLAPHTADGSYPRGARC